MKAGIVSKSSRFDIPIAFANGKKPLFSQDFIVVDNLLVNNPDFVNTLHGVLLTSAKPNMTLKAPRIELTAEFVQGESSLIPMWYSQILRKTVKATNVIRKTIEITTNPGDTVAILGPLIDTPKSYVVANTASILVNGQVQSESAFYIDRGGNRVLVNIGNSSQANVVSFSYDIVQLSLDATIDSGQWSVIPSLHFGDRYIARMIYSEATVGEISYISEDKTETDIVVADPLFQEVPKEIVSPRTFTFSYEEFVTFPNSEPYILYAIRSADSTSRTMVSIKAPGGLGQSNIWFIQISGKIPDGYHIPEIPTLLYNSQPRKEDVTVVGPRKVRLGSKDIAYSISPDGKRLEGIKLYDPEDPGSLIPLSGYNKQTGIGTLATDVPVGNILTAEYLEFVDWVEYEGIQFNPVFAEDKGEIINNYVVIYFINDPALESTISHMFLPKTVDGSSKIYTFDEIEKAVKEIHPLAIPMALVQVVEPVDQDYFTLYDVRQLGGKWGNDMTDYSYWDGESVDLTGQFFTIVSSKLVDKVKQVEKDWAVNITDEEARRLAKERIEKVVKKYIRVGMNNEIIYE